MAIVFGRGLKKRGYVLELWPGLDRKLQRCERSLGEFSTHQEAFGVLMAHFKRVSAGLKAAQTTQSLKGVKQSDT